MTVTKDDKGRLNQWATEPTMYIDKEDMEKFQSGQTHNSIAERLNGRLAMIGFVALLGAYVTTGQIIPGVF